MESSASSTSNGGSAATISNSDRQEIWLKDKLFQACAILDFIGTAILAISTEGGLSESDAFGLGALMGIVKDYLDPDSQALGGAK